MLAAIEAALDSLEAREHLQGTRPDLQPSLEVIDTLLAPVLGALTQADPPDDLFDAIEAEIDADDRQPTKAIMADEGSWHQLTDKIWKKILGEDPTTGQSMYLLRCLPGAQIPPHPHEHAEHAYILEGELVMAGKTYRAGDAQTSSARTLHALVDIPKGCLVLISG